MSCVCVRLCCCSVVVVSELLNFYCAKSRVILSSSCNQHYIALRYNERAHLNHVKYRSEPSYYKKNVEMVWL